MHKLIELIILSIPMVAFLWFAYDAQPHRQKDGKVSVKKTKYLMISLALGCYAMAVVALSDDYQKDSHRLFGQFLNLVAEKFGPLAVSLIWLLFGSVLMYAAFKVPIAQRNKDLTR